MGSGSTRILPSDLDYTARDFDALAVRLERAIRSVFPKWTDYAVANFGNILLESVQWVGDVLGYYQGKLARESRFVTCRDRVNGIRHARLIGYTFGRQTAATVDVLLGLQGGPYDEITVLAGSVIRTLSVDPLRFQVLSNVTIPAAATQATFPVEHSLTHTDTQESSDLADQEFILTQSPYLELVELRDDLGVFSVVPNFLDSDAASSHVVERVSDEDRAQLVFGDGRNGRIPVGDIIATYKTGGGSISLDFDQLRQPEFTLTDAGLAPVSFTVTNPAGPSGGTPRQSLGEAQREAPATLRVASRSVTRADFEINAARVAGVARSVMLTSDEDSRIAENYGQLAIVAKGSTLASGAVAPATPSSVLLDEVRALIDDDYPPPITFDWDPVAATLKTVDVLARVRLAEGADPAVVDAAIRADLADGFAVLAADGTVNDRVAFGYYYRNELGVPESRIPWSDIFEIVLDATGVRSVDEDSFVPVDSVPVELNEFPVLGTVTLINDRTGLPLVSA